MWQNTPGSSSQWSSWDPIGTTTGWSSRKRPTVGLNPDGILEVFMIGGTDNNLWHTWHTSNNSGKWPMSWSTFDTHQWPLGSNPSIASNKDGRIEIFVRDFDGNIYHKWQTSKNNSGTWDWSNQWVEL